MSYLWVVVVSNYQKLGQSQDGDDALLVDTNAWSRQKGCHLDGEAKRKLWKQSLLIGPGSMRP